MLPIAGYALSSVEGRVAMEFFDMSEAGQAKKWAFASPPGAGYLFSLISLISFFRVWATLIVHGYFL